MAAPPTHVLLLCTAGKTDPALVSQQAQTLANAYLSGDAAQRTQVSKVRGR